MSEQETLDAIEQAARLLTAWRQSVAEQEHQVMLIDIDEIRMLEQQMWSAHMMAKYGMLHHAQSNEREAGGR